VDEMMGVWVTIADPGARVDAFAPGVSLDLDPESSGKGGGNTRRQKYHKERAFVVIIN